ncbi:MAG: hypothetical protein ACHQ5A_07640 [Opitutales bacterium]
MAVGTVFAQQDSNQALLDLLVRKGVITQSEATGIKQELKAAQSTPAAAPAAPAAPAGAVVDKTAANPLSFKLGVADFTPFGFIDFTGVYRTTNTGSSINTNFGNVPFSNVYAGHLSEQRFSAGNTRLGLRVDSTVDDMKVMAMYENDLLGNAATSIGVTSNSLSWRVRLAFMDLKWSNWEILAGQGWSMLTAGRSGISPLPGDLFYSKDADANYQAGVVWARQPQLRFVYHASKEFTAGFSLENPDQYIGGGGGSTAVVLPTGFSGANQVDNGGNTNVANPFPDLIGKLAYDTKIDGNALHLEVAGLYRNFKINTFATGATPVNIDSSASAFSESFNANLELTKGLHLIGNTFYGKGGGRYILGLAPDFIVNAAPNATSAYTISTLTSWSYLGGVEWDATPKDSWFAYYSNVGIGKKSTVNTNGSLAGYGYTGSSAGMNKQIEEYTLGYIRTLWKNPTYGSLFVEGQISYLDRTPWYVAAGAPAKASTNMFYVDMRYNLP